MQRIIRITLGDDFCDGHGLHSTVTVQLSGEQVTDEHLRATFDSNVEQTGMNPLEMFSDFLEQTVDGEDFDKIREAGYTPFECDDTRLPVSVSRPGFYIEDMDDFEEDYMDTTPYSYPHLLLWYLTHGGDLSVKVIEYDALLGEDGILRGAQYDNYPGSPAYGLFNKG